MDLTEYDKFELVSTLITNRDKIVWCTSMLSSRAAAVAASPPRSSFKIHPTPFSRIATSTYEKVDVEVAMREKGVGWILKELRGGDAATAAARDT
jgi:pre-mRNA-splicing helicase BRR2